MGTYLAEMAGWVGTFFYLLGYLLLTIKKIKSTEATYQILNVIGAVGLIINALYPQNNPNLVVNGAWLLIGLGALLSRFKWKSSGVSEADVNGI